MKRRRALFLLFLNSGVFALSLNQAVWAQTQEKVYPAVVVGKEAIIFQLPDSKSRELRRLAGQAAVKVVSEATGWYRVYFSNPDGSSAYGWMRREDLKLSQSMTPELTGTPVVEEKKEQRNEVDRPPTIELAGFQLSAAPVLNVYQFGATQVRFGLAYDFPLASERAVGLLTNYSYGGGFSVMGWGAQFTQVLTPVEGKTWGIYTRGDLRGERFFGSGQSFYGFTVAGAMGFHYQAAKGIAYRFEPVSLEWTPVNSADLPSFLRMAMAASIQAVWK